RAAFPLPAGVLAMRASLLPYTALGDFARRLPSLAVPLLLWVTMAGAALFLFLTGRAAELPLRADGPVPLVAAMATGLLVVALDPTPKIHYTLTKLPAAPAGRAAAAPEGTVVASASAGSTSSTTAPAPSTAGG